jgi:2-succinyl-6-hydroxy-2,4-cyclohexadiene-1-carboxylate synthase
VSEGPLHYRIAGPDDGPLILLLHGFLGSLRDWDDVVAELANGFRCVAVDLPGHGQSPVADEPPTMLSTSTLLVDLVDDLGADTYNVVGYSMGGRLALYLALMFPMRIDHLILESATAGLVDDAEREERRARDEALARRLESEPLEGILGEWYDAPLWANLRPEQRADMAARRAHNDPRGLAQALRGMGQGAQPPQWDDLSRHTLPTLLIAGADDPVYSAIVLDMAERMGNARADVVFSAGHNVHLERPGVFAEIVRGFLAGD